MSVICGLHIVRFTFMFILSSFYAIIGVLKLSFGFTRRGSVTRVLFSLGWPSFNTVLHNCEAIFMRTWLNSSNSIVSYVRRILVS